LKIYGIKLIFQTYYHPQLKTNDKILNKRES